MQETLTFLDCYTYHSWYLWLFVVLFLLLNLEGKPMILFSNVLFNNDILESTYWYEFTICRVAHLFLVSLFTINSKKPNSFKVSALLTILVYYSLLSFLTVIFLEIFCFYLFVVFNVQYNINNFFVNNTHFYLMHRDI